MLFYSNAWLEKCVTLKWDVGKFKKENPDIKC